MQTLKGHKGAVKVLAFVPGANHLISSAGTGTSFSVWELGRSKRSYLKGHEYKPTGLAFSPSGTRLVTCDERAGTRIWVNSAGWQQVNLRRAHHAAWTGEQTLALSIYEDLTFEDVVTDKPVAPAVKLEFPKIRIAGLAATSDGRVLAGVFGTYLLLDPALALIRPGQTPAVGPFRPLDGVPADMVFSPTGETLAFAIGSSVRLLDLPADQVRTLSEGHTKRVTGLAFRPDGRLLSCSLDGTARTWDVPSGRCLGSLDWRLGGLTALAVARDGLRAAVGAHSGDVLVWDLD